jgi:molybdopterin-guanine dinucleotide biosynthesis protein A
VVISANDPRPYEHLNVPIIADRHADIGPLGGIEAVLTELAPRAESVLFLPCDLPNFSRQEILRLLQAYRAAPGRVVVAHTVEGDHPLCAVVPVTALPNVTAAVAAGSYGVGQLWRSLDAIPVKIDDATRLANVNTPEDVLRWRNSANRDHPG